MVAGGGSHKSPDQLVNGCRREDSRRAVVGDSSERRNGSPESDQALITDEDIRDFQELYRVCFGKDISFEEACEQGVHLLRLVETILRVHDSA